jgi:hypothetical protein
MNASAENPSMSAVPEQQAVSVLVAELNRIVGPVLSASLGNVSSAAGRVW